MISLFKPIFDFYSHPVFTVAGGLVITLSVLGIAYRLVCWVFGITPILFRLGAALWGRKIAIFASTTAYPDLKTALTDTGLFHDKNVLSVTPNNIDRAVEATVFLVDWGSFDSEIEKVFNKRGTHQTPIVIYAKPASIPQEKMSDIANRANTVVVNFRGRLLNDILTSLMTTSYEKRRT